MSACLVIISHHSAETQLLEYLIMLNMKGEKEGGDTKDHLGKGVCALKDGRHEIKCEGVEG